MGYGDIGVKTRIEFTMAIILMFAGVLFYSNILSELLTMIDKTLEKQEKIQTKFHLLKLLQKDIKLDKALVREIRRDILTQDDEMDERGFKPNFEGVLERDAEDLMYEAHEKDFRGIELFNKRDKSFLIDFALSMKQEQYLEGQVVYEEDQKPDYFYVIKQGSVGFFLPGDHMITFYECHSGYFGETELLKDKDRMYTVKCLEPTTLYKLSKAVFEDLFLERERKFKLAFLEIANKRATEIDKALHDVKALAAKLLDDIRFEFNQLNPFYKLQHVVRSEKFRNLINQRKKMTKKEKNQFLNEQRKRKDQKKKTIFIEANLDFEKDNEDGKSEGKGSNTQSYQISQKISAKLRRKQVAQKKSVKKYIKMKQNQDLNPQKRGSEDDLDKYF